MKKNSRERLDTKGILKNSWINKFSSVNKMNQGTLGTHKSLEKCIIQEVYGLIATIKLENSDKNIKR